MESISNIDGNELRGLFIDVWKIHRLPNDAKCICRLKNQQFFIDEFGIVVSRHLVQLAISKR
jgi:hypothetical protein